MKELNHYHVLEKLKHKYKDNEKIKFTGKLTNFEVLSLIKNSYTTITNTSLYEGQPTLLSEASKLSLKVQGGPFTKEEAEEFISKPFMDEAVELRRFDDLAKILDKKTPDVEHFRPYLEEARKSFLASQ